MHVCAFLCNFQPALVPPPQSAAEGDAQEYIDGLTDSDSDFDSLIVRTYLHNQSAPDYISIVKCRHYLYTFDVHLNIPTGKCYYNYQYSQVH